MKVLVLPSWYLPDGAYFIKEQSLFLQEKGVEIALLANTFATLTIHKSGFLSLPWGVRVVDEDGLNTYRTFTRKIPKLERLNIHLWTRITLQLFEKYVSKEGLPDIIHVHSAMWGGYAAALIKKRYKVPYIITEHLGIMALQSEYSMESLPKWKDPYFCKAYQNADYIVPVSDQLMRKISQYIDTSVSWKAIPNIVDTQFFYPNHTKKGCFRFVCMNGFYPEKGYDILLKAFDLFCETNREAEIYIAGENFEQQTFQIMLQACRNKDKIHFTGKLNREGVRQLLWSADAFLLPSRVEAQPIAVLEALSCGVPVVCTDVVPVFVMPPENGFWMPNEDANGFAKGMCSIFDQIDQFDRSAISEYTKTIASKEIVIDQIIEIYHRVLKRNDSSVEIKEE